MRFMSMIRTRRIEVKARAARERHARDYLYAATAKGR